MRQRPPLETRAAELFRTAAERAGSAAGDAAARIFTRISPATRGQRSAADIPALVRGRAGEGRRQMQPAKAPANNRMTVS
ncbi:MAG TPA: hypothetical protein PLI86_05090, partial [bacterium]|nr:hypothetical protein [bacterium]